VVLIILVVNLDKIRASFTRIIPDLKNCWNQFPPNKKAINYDGFLSFAPPAGLEPATL
jgi:hypothetical protein